MASGRIKTAKIQIVATLPDLGDAEVNEFYYDSTNGKLVLRTIGGWKYWTQD